MAGRVDYNLVENEAVLYSSALEKAHTGYFKYAILGICGSVIASISGPGSSLVQSRHIITCNLKLDYDEQMKINVYTLIALMSGSLLISIPSDLSSRLKPFLLSLIIYGFSTIGLGFCREFYCFACFSVFRAFWASALLAIITVYVAEIQTPEYRGSGLCCLQVFWLIGIAVMTVVSIPWRISQFVFGVSALLLSILVFLYLPESPRLLLSLEKDEAAINSLEKLHRRNHCRDKDEVEYPVKNVVDDFSPEAKDLRKLETYVPKALRPAWYCVFVVLQIQFVFNLCFFTMRYWFEGIDYRHVLIFPIIPVELDKCKLGERYLPVEVNDFFYHKKNGSTAPFDYSPCKSVEIDADYTKGVSTLVLSTLPILIFMIFRIDHVGRTFFTVLSHAIAGLLSFWVHYLMGTKHSHLYTCLMEIMWIISWTTSVCLAVEIFRTRIRVLGVGLANAFGHLGMIMGIYGVLSNASGQGNCIFVISLTGIVVTAGGLTTLSLPDVVRVNLK